MEEPRERRRPPRWVLALAGATLLLWVLLLTLLF